MIFQVHHVIKHIVYMRVEILHVCLEICEPACALVLAPFKVPAEMLDVIVDMFEVLSDMLDVVL